MVILSSQSNDRFTQHRLFILYLLLTMLCLACQYSENLAMLMTWHKDAIMQYQLWRIFTGHCVHYNITHCISNLIFLWSIYICFRHYFSAVLFMILIMLSCCTISFTLYFFDTVNIYFGLSGLLYSLLSFSLCQLIYHRYTIGYIYITVFIIKLYYDYQYHINDIIHIEIASIAHFIGALSGVILFLQKKLLN